MLFRKAHSTFSRYCLALALAAALVGCSKEVSECRVTLNYEGRAIRGVGPSRHRAESDACTKSCLQHDTSLEQRWQVWKAAGDKSSNGKANDVEKAPALKAELTRCEKTCSRALARGQAHAKVDSGCEK